MSQTGTAESKSITRRPKGRAERPAEQTVSVLGLSAQVTLGLTLLALPWFLGGVQTSVQFWLFAAVLVPLLCCMFMQLQKETPAFPLPAAIVPLGLAIALGVLQLVPLPVQTLRSLSPNSARLWDDLTGASSLESLARQLGEERLAFDLGAVPLAEHPTISLHPSATRRDLSCLILASGVFLLGVCLFSAGKQPIAILVGMSVLGTAMAFFGIAQQLSWTGKIYGFVDLPEGAQPFAAFVNRNNAGGFLNLCLAGAVGLTVWSFSRKGDVQLPLRQPSAAEPFLRRHEAVRWILKKSLAAAAFFASLNVAKLFGLTALVFTVAGVVCCLSRGAWLGAAGGVFVVAVLLGVTRRSWVVFWLFVPIVLTAMMLVMWLGREELLRDRFPSIQSVQSSAEVRWNHWPAGLRAARDFRLLGSGLGTYRHVYRLYEKRPSPVWFYHAENQPLEALVEGGVVGLSLLLVVFLLVLVASLRLLREPVSSTSNACGIAGCFALASQAICGSLDFGLYIPANMALLAVFCGVLTGRAARLSQKRDRTRQLAFARLRSSLFALPNTHALAAACIAIVAAGVTWGSVETRRAAALSDAMSRSPIPKPPAKAPVIGVEDRAREELGPSIRSMMHELYDRPDDAEGQRRAAKLWLYRYRLSMYARLQQQPPPDVREDQLWDLTSPLQLHAYVQLLTRDQRRVELDQLRQSPEVQIDVANAVRHLLLSRMACPLLGDVHVLLAELEPVLSDDVDFSVLAERAGKTVGANPSLLAECGTLALQMGRYDEGVEDWKKCVELDSAWLPKFLNAALMDPELEKRLEKMLPDSPAALIDAARQFPDDGNQRRIRDAVLGRTDQLLSAAHPADPEACRFRGQVFALRGEGKKAIDQYSIATLGRPDEIEWCYELALLLRANGEHSKAQFQATVCYTKSPETQRYKDLYEELAPKTKIEKNKTDTKGKTP